MSLDHTSGAPDGEHLGEEATSAVLDGDAGADELAHLGRCATCRASLERLRAAQAAVAAPVRLDADAREAAVSRALDAYDDDRAVRPPVPQAGPVRTLPARGADRWRRAAPLPWLGVAAVLLLVVLAVPLLRGAGGGPTSTQSDIEAAGGDAAGDGAESDEAAAAAAPPVDVGDLGAIEIGEDLRPVVDAALGAAPDEETSSDDRAGAGSEEAIASGDDASGQELEAEQGGGAQEAEESAPQPTTAPEAAPERATARLGSEEDAFQQAQATCEPTVRAALPEAGPLVLVGSGTVDGAPALVFGFTGPSERPAVLTALVRREGCELVTFQSYILG